MTLGKHDLAGLVEVVRAGKKYKYLCRDTIHDIISREIGQHKNVKETLKTARKRLHLILADYLSDLDVRGCREKLTGAFASGDEAQIRRTCLDIMSRHASTRERLPLLDRFYGEIFAITGQPQTIADLACALNPFSSRWLGLPSPVRYFAYDNNRQTVDLLGLYFRLENISPLPEERDILCCPPEGPFDVAFLFKMYHCLEHRQKGAGWQVVQNTPAAWLVLSFPTRSLANRRVDILGNYREKLLENIRYLGFHYQELEFPGEVLLLIRKNAG